jgi:DNA-binding CsgD family transcriptional regulator
MSAPSALGRVVGRDDEFAALGRLVAEAGASFHALVIEGEPGIGKTTLCRVGAELARGQRLTVLSCNPVEAETKLAFAALGDLLAPVTDALVEELPAPQRVALEVALLRAPAASGRTEDGRALGMALQSVLRRLSGSAPVLVVIDDVQWLDTASAAALAFACRRLPDCPVRLLVARRLEPGSGDDVLGLRRALPGTVEWLTLGPLRLSSLYHLIRAELGQAFPRPTLLRIESATGGNPLFALELARALAEEGALPGPGEPLPVPSSLAELLGRRVRRLSPEAQETLLVAASLPSPDALTVEAALRRTVQGDLDEAERAGVVEPLQDRLRFSHPLLASTVYRGAPPAKRRAAHSALASVVTEPEQHARHLALAANGPDNEVAVALGTAAASAAARGAPEVAVELIELACHLTPPGGVDLAQRRLSLAEYRFRAGDADGARQLASDLFENLPRGQLRAAAAELSARVLHVAGTAPEAAAYCLDALEDPDLGTALSARLHATLALVSWHDFGLARRHAQLSLQMLDDAGEDDLAVRQRALMAYAQAEFYAGNELSGDVVQRGLELERLAPPPTVAERMSASLGAWLKYQGDFDGARLWLDATLTASRIEGDDSSLPYALSHLPQLELWAGNWARAESLSREHLEVAAQMAQASQLRQAWYNLSIVQAHLGLADEARATASELLAEADAEGDDWDASNALSVLGFVELSLGDTMLAASLLARSLELHEALGGRDPLRSHADYAEALLKLGQRERASEVVGILCERAALAKREPLLAIAARARGQVAADGGDLEGASTALDEALAHHERVTVPFDLARTLMVLGQVNRRRGERKAAKAALERATKIFHDLGAPLWKAQAEAESRRVPVRHGAPLELTPTEEQVAKLAAIGRTNREVAKELFISPKTVEANLTRAYRKLGIASRAELGAVMAARAR